MGSPLIVLHDSMNAQMRQCNAICLPREREASRNQVPFGDDAYLVLVILLTGGFVLYPFISDYFPLVLILLYLAILAHVRTWYRSLTREVMGGTGWDEKQG